MPHVGRPCPFNWEGQDITGDDVFAGLALHIVGQQNSIPAALTINRRLGELGRKPAAQGLPRLPVHVHVSGRLRKTGRAGVDSLVRTLVPRRCPPPCPHLCRHDLDAARTRSGFVEVARRGRRRTCAHLDGDGGELSRFSQD